MTSQISYPECGNRIIIRPVRSLQLFILIFSLHGMALLSLFFIDLNFLLLMVLAGLILYSQYRFYLSENTITHGLSLQQGERLLFQANEASDWQDADLLESFVSRWLLVLKIRTLIDTKQHSMVIMADSIDVQLFRRLIVFLNGYHEQE